MRLFGCGAEIVKKEYRSSGVWTTECKYIYIYIYLKIASGSYSLFTCGLEPKSLPRHRRSHKATEKGQSVTRITVVRFPYLRRSYSAAAKTQIDVHMGLRDLGGAFGRIYHVPPLLS
jgi:hypothetical protein